MSGRVRDDMKMIFGQDPTACSALKVIIACAGLHTVWSHLIAHKLYDQKKYVVARAISQISRFFTDIEVHPGAKIGKRLLVNRGMGVVIEETCTTGDNVTIYQGMTLGGTGKERREKHSGTEDNVLITAGAKVLGNIKINSNVNIGVNSVILQSVPSHSTIVGIPGYIAKQDSVRVGETSNHRHLPDPIYEQIKHLER